MTRTIFTVVGARPQFIKAAAVSRVIAGRPNLNELIVHTGQHYDPDMSDVFFDELGIPVPARRYEFGGGSHGAMTGKMLAAIEEALVEDKPDAVLVYGDTNSTLAGALAAAKLHIPVIHVEAGLRSFNRRMPEEINRVMADHLSALLLCPTQTGVDNLKAEGITRGVHAVGDVMHDATLYAIEQARAKSDVIEKLDLEGRDYAVCTLHRAENTDDPDRFTRIIAFLEEQARERLVVFPVHPRTRKVMAERGISPKGVKQVDPMGYFDLNRLMAGSSLVLTDSGGLQKEAYFHRKPAITLRDETEWVETIEAGWNRLWTQKDWKSPRRDILDYGQGDAGERTVDAIEAFLG
ncbi:non-hydrolyzing UDP-N-acetylglucosamine 2-epimerase [Hyphobacterium indicum]|uniref:non-hydrolyzing UDP-N-acetylglucosamine 2-epimerase n=1 Tax=Hyphobacterium indicum TaxID=2162714 RepID=UPI000D64A894|nr:UDP-N-acetylglucosamine 2-epimerase (non-hydrolyzing) [Hyphobacterium indicum]